MTLRRRTLANSVIRASVMPSENQSSVELGDRSLNGKTRIEETTGRAAGPRKPSTTATIASSPIAVAARIQLGFLLMTTGAGGAAGRTASSEGFLDSHQASSSDRYA